MCLLSFLFFTYCVIKIHVERYIALHPCGDNISYVVIDHQIEFGRQSCPVPGFFFLSCRSRIGAISIPLSHSAEVVNTINAISFWYSMPLWAVTLLGILLITVLFFLTVYCRMFKLFLYAAIILIPLATFAGELSNSVGKIPALVCLE